MRQVLLFVCTAVTLVAANPNFNDPRSYLVQNTLTALEGDFNGDHKTDLAVVSSDGFIQMLIGNGNGTFRAQASTIPMPYPVAAAVGDFNGDGKLDIVIASSATSNISVLLGNGKGGFAKPITTASPIQPAYMTIGDVNNDGFLDVVLGGLYTTNTPFQVFLGKGTGKFGPPQAVYTAPGGMGQPVLMDVNHDGKLDLTFVYGLGCGCPFGKIGTQLGNGDGTFAVPNYFPVVGALNFTFADLNGDGIPDLGRHVRAAVSC